MYGTTQEKVFIMLPAVDASHQLVSERAYQSKILFLKVEVSEAHTNRTKGDLKLCGLLTVNSGLEPGCNKLFLKACVKENSHDITLKIHHLGGRVI
jgi:hypothetical protein